MANPSKRKGSAFEAQVASYLADALQDDRIERRTLGGINDRGDIGGVRIAGKRAVIECKATKALKVGEHLAEAETERANDSAAFGVVVWKRPRVGAGNMGQQAVIMTLETFVSLIKEIDHE